MIKDALRNQFNAQAEWRDQKAEEYPEDERNGSAAEHLRALAEWVDALPDEDPRLLAFSEIFDDELDFFSGFEEADRLVSRFGFDGEVRPDQFDGFLAKLLEESRREYLRDLGPEDLLPWVDHDDPAASLPAIAALGEGLDDREEVAVLKARAEGLSWARIGNLLNRSKQAVWERYRDPDDGPETA